jgi:RNA polymerase sigma-70 factor (ECF subfamily)
MNGVERDPAYTSLSDGDLIAAIGLLDEAALSEVYQRHAGAVFSLASRVLVERTFAEEIVQEVFLRLWNQPDRFDPERGTLRSFLLAHAHGRSVDLLRSDHARRRREERDERVVRSTARADYDVEHQVWDMALAEQVRAALGALPVSERNAIELAYFGGKTYREVAVELGEAEGTVKGRIRSGLRRLRGELSAAGLTMGEQR